jgi:hypothetical protein
MFMLGTGTIASGIPDSAFHSVSDGDLPTTAVTGDIPIMGIILIMTGGIIPGIILPITATTGQVIMTGIITAIGMDTTGILTIPIIIPQLIMEKEILPHQVI